MIGDVISGRYELLAALGEGGFGQTWRALDRATGGEVALKVLALDRAKDWKSVELFEREANVLRALDHPRIPAYIDSFEVDQPDGSRTFYLAQQLAPGRDLEHLVKVESWHPTTDELLSLARDILELLVYLHDRHPPVVHRDIKPHNILRAPDGEVSLVDFGAVKRSLSGPTGGSTVVGTFGYMAPEQFRGAAHPQTDLFGLGATLVFLLTHTDPAKLPTRKLAIDLDEATPHIDPNLKRWLGRLLEPDYEERFGSAREALDALSLRGDATTAPAEPTEEPAPSDGARADTSATPRATPDDPGWDASQRAGTPGCAIFAVISLIASVVIGATFAAAYLPYVLAVGWIFFAICVAVGLSPDDDLNHPRAKFLTARANIVSGFVSSLPAVIYSALLLHDVGVSAAFGANIASALLAFTITWLFASDWRGWRQQLTLERQLGGELPMPEAETAPTLEFRMDRTSEPISFSRAQSFSPLVWLHLAALSGAFGGALELLGTSAPNDVWAAGAGIFGVASLVIAIITAIRNRASRTSMSLSSFGDLRATLLGDEHPVMRRDHIERITVKLDPHHSDLQSYVVRARVTLIDAHEPITIFEVEEKSRVMATSLALILRQELWGWLASGTRDEVVFDFSQVRELTESSEGESITWEQERGVSAW